MGKKKKQQNQNQEHPWQEAIPPLPMEQQRKPSASEKIPPKGPVQL